MSKRKSVIGANGKPCAITSGMCACCGFSAGVEGNERGWHVFVAGWADSDGVYFARLCGDLFGSGCIYEVPPAKDELAEIVTEMAGDDLDAAQADYEDFRLWWLEQLKREPTHLFWKGEPEKFYAYICTKYAEGVQTDVKDFIEVEGRPLKIEGFEEFDLFIHKAVGNPDLLVMAEAHTGAKIGRGVTEQEAIDEAISRMETAGLDELRRQLEKLTAKYGLSPRYMAKAA